MSYDIARPTRTVARNVGLAALVAAAALTALTGWSYHPLTVVPLALVLGALFIPRGSTLRTVMLAVAGVLMAMTAALVVLAGLLLVALFGLGGGNVG